MRIFLYIKKIFSSLNISVCRAVQIEKVTLFIASIKLRKPGLDLVRLGGDGDGGYLLPNDLDGIAACFSPGVGPSSNFELDIAKRGIKCFLADYSVESPPVNHDLFEFDKVFVGANTTETHININEWIKKKEIIVGDLILQMDIEGDEYDVLMEIDQLLLKRFRIIVIEFHRFDQIINPIGLTLINAVFQKLQVYFSPVHLHPNNAGGVINYCGVSIPINLEVTFFRNDRFIQESGGVGPIKKNKLDKINNTRYEEINLSEEWYR
jgi:hypothetical protein